jgi:riboflavin synthase alpha subunit
VNQVGEDFIGLSLIPETLALTTLGSKQPGDKVNVEADVMAKHIERLLEARKVENSLVFPGYRSGYLQARITLLSSGESP